MADSRQTDRDDRAGELRALAGQRNAWRSHRREIVVAFGTMLSAAEGIADLRASQDDDAPSVVLVTDQRVLIGRWSAGESPAMEQIEFDEIVSVDLGANVAGSFAVTTRTGRSELHRYSARDAEAVTASISQRLLHRQRQLHRRSERKPFTDLEMLESLRRSGVLTEHEFRQVRDRLIQQIAVRQEAEDLEPAKGPGGPIPRR